MHTGFLLDVLTELTDWPVVMGPLNGLNGVN